MSRRKKSSFDLAVGEALAEFRAKKGLTQTEAATVLSTTQTNLSRYENGISTPSPTTLYAAIQAYDASPNKFFATAEQIAAAKGVLEGNTKKRSK